MAAKKIAKVVKAASVVKSVAASPITGQAGDPNTLSGLVKPIDVAVMAGIVESASEEEVVEALKEPSFEELIGKFFLDAQDNKESRLMISVGGPKGTVSIERYGLVPKIVFGKSLSDAIQKIGGSIGQ